MEAVAYDWEIRVEAAMEAAKIAERGMKETTEEVEVKAASVKATAFLSFLVGVHTYRCIFLNYSQ